MAILDNIKRMIDIPRWQQMAPMAAHVAGTSLCTDKRNDGSAFPIIYHLVSATVFNFYIGDNNGSPYFVVSPGLSGFGAGSATIFCPSMGPRGSIGAGCSNVKIVTTTAITSIPQNLWAINAQVGQRIRIIGLANGIIEERFVVSNTGGTTPTIYLNEALSFVPVVGDLYELLSGRIYMLGTTAGATQFRYYDMGTSSMVSAGNTALLIATDSSMQCLDEQYVPFDRKPGEGFLVGAGTYDTAGVATTKNCLIATATAAGTITGQAAAGDAGVIANEYRNFQIRIVEDTVAPTAIGQRRTIASHTGPGASPVYTLGSNWAVQPSANAKFVIENPNVILLFTVAAGTTTYTYNYTPATINNGTNTIASGAFSTTYFGARGTVVAAGTFSLPSWSHEPTTNLDGTRLTRHSYVYSFRGGVVTLDMLDIAGGVTGLWTNALPYQGIGTAFGTGSGGRIAPVDQGGEWGYIILNNTNQIFRFNIKYWTLNPWVALPAQAGTAAVGERIEILPYMKLPGCTDKLSLIYVQGHLATTLYRSEAIV
jgi:hypothetical protein